VTCGTKRETTTVRVGIDEAVAGEPCGALWGASEIPIPKRGDFFALEHYLKKKRRRAREEIRAHDVAPKK
jgi:hypothetical protein